MNNNTIVLSLNNEAHIIVPDDVNLMTRFVLEEQGDWFEDEIHFVRKLLGPGMSALDIGANVGCYALSMAARVGPTGQVWAFEPCASTYQLLQASRDLNSLIQLNTIQAGLSSEPGQATLYRSNNSELNSLHPKANRRYPQETIELVTLDQSWQELKWPNFDFIKLDAEGEEQNILAGGRQCLKHMNPVVMFELKHGKQLHQALIDDFNQLDFDCFYLNRRLNCLLPFNADDIEGYQLNLFALKAAKQTQLQARDLLLAQSPTALACDSLAMAIDHIVVGEQGALSKADRLAHWQSAYEWLSAHSEQSNDVTLLSAYVRVCEHLGQRQRAVACLRKLIPLSTTQSTSIAPSSSFTAPADQSDLRAACLSIYIRLHAFSSYFSGDHVLAMLDELNAGRFGTEFTRARAKLIRSRSS